MQRLTIVTLLVCRNVNVLAYPVIPTRVVLNQPYISLWELELKLRNFWPRIVPKCISRPQQLLF